LYYVKNKEFEAENFYNKFDHVESAVQDDSKYAIYFYNDNDLYSSMLKDVEAEKAPYVVGGCVLASARGRDSGAKVGEGVRLLNGDIDSGGSMRNWTSTIGANSKFKIESFPSDYDLNSHKDYKDIKIELIEFENIGFDEDEVITFQVSSLVEKLVDLGLNQSQINSILEL